MTIEEMGPALASAQVKITELEKALEAWKKAHAAAIAAVPVAAQGVLEHVPNVDRCPHVANGSEGLEPWALVRVQTLPGCDYRGEPLALATVTCALCAGRAIGSMSMSESEVGMDREELDAAAADITTRLRLADLKPSTWIAAGLLEAGITMARSIRDEFRELQRKRIARLGSEP